MENKINKLLARQIKRHFGSLDNLPVELKGIINDINSSYEDFEEDTKLLQNSIEISSQELRSAYKQHKQDAENQKETIDKIKEAIYAIKPASDVDNIDAEVTVSESSSMFDSLIKLIEEWKKADEALRWNQSLMQLMSESSPLGFLVVDNRTDDILYFNPRFCEIWGIQHLADKMKQGFLKSNDIIRERIKVLVDKPAYVESCKPLQDETNRTVVEDEIPFIENRTIRRFSTQIRGEHDQYYGRFYIFEDITERKRIESKKIRQSGLIFALLDSTPDLIFYKDTKGVYIGCNPAFTNYMDKSRNEIIGKTDYDLFDKDRADFFTTNDKKILLEKQPQKNEEWIEYPDGRKVFLETVKTAFRAKNGETLGLLGISRDNTERKVAEKDLRASEERFNQLAEHSRVINWEVDPSGLYTFISPSCIAVLGYSPEEITGKKYFQDLHPVEEWKNIKKAAIKVFARKEPFRNIENPMQTRDEQIIWVSTSGIPVLDDAGRFAGYRGTDTDITERKQAIEALLESESRFKMMSDNAPVLMWMSDTDAQYNFFNQSWLEFTGRTLEQELGNGWTEGVHPDDIQVCLNTYLKSFKAHRKFRMEYRLKHADGEYRWLLDNGVPRFTPDGIFAGYIGTCVDITENKRVEETLRNLSQAVEQSPVSIMITDIKGDIKYVNSTVFKLTGYKPEELLGENLRVFSSDEVTKLKYKQLWKTISSGKEWRGEFHNKKKNGELYWELASISAVKNPKGEIVNFLAINEDITERKQVEEKLKTNEENFRTFFSSIADLLFVLDGKGNLIDVNETVIRRLEYTKEELIGQSVLVIFPEARRDVVEIAVAGMLAGTKNFCHVPVISKSGVETQVETRVYPGVWDGEPALFGVVKDITEVKQSEEKFSKAFQSSSNLMVISSIKTGFFIDVNNMFLQLLGFTREDIIGKTSEEINLFEDLNHWNTIKSTIKEKGYAKDVEVKVKAKTGEDLIGLLSTSSIHIGNEPCWLTTVTDITKRKQVEEELEENREKHRGLSEASFEAIFISEKGICVEQNHAAERMFGYTSEEAMTRLGTDWIVPEDREMVMNNMVSGRETPYEALALRKDGTTFPSILRGRMMRYKGREVRVTALTDITDRKQAEEAVKRASTRLALATRAGGIGIWELDIVNNIIFPDDQMYILFGIEKKDDDSFYETWLKAIIDEDRNDINEEMQMAIKGEKDFDTEFRVCWPDSSIHNIRALAIVQHDDSGNPVRMIGTIWDITEQKKIEAVLNKARQDAEMANKSKSVFLANMSHEIRTPLNAIIGFSQLMNRDPLLTDSQKEYNLSIIRAGEHLLSLINDILELSKMEAGRLELNPTNVDLNALFSDIRMIFKEPAESKHLLFILETIGDIPPYVIVDDNKLRRIFINLIGNAIKFTDKGGVAVRARVEKTDQLKSRLVVEVQDSGSGIPECELDKLFKHFVQTSTGMNKSSGSGLGLALSRELAILMGGEITVTSKEGKGSVFTFHVEMEKGNYGTQENMIKERVLGLAKGQESYRILVVDDKEENLQVVVTLLQMVGFETMEAVNGEDAIVKFEEWDPHLILMDMRMPIMDGYEASRRIKLTEKGKRTPIIALTASSFEDERKKIFALDMQGYIRKPFRQNELFGTIGNILGVKYIYEDEAPIANESNSVDDNSIVKEIAKLPEDLVLQMKEAIAIADLDQLIDLINSIKTDHSELASHLMNLADNFDYDYLQQILNNKE